MSDGICFRKRDFQLAPCTRDVARLMKLAPGATEIVCIETSRLFDKLDETDREEWEEFQRSRGYRCFTFYAVLGRKLRHVGIGPLRSPEPTGGGGYDIEMIEVDSVGTA